ncbi:heat shock protein Hsp30/Hsp42, putative [Talaromyces stipitatus ATCC 10500]|uniref:Heat shock protein Hsp30/Hsp42, putative n=1 Tax=Talaromyces stipitatus (strain ATCC 10500 / CBS 375.48 / QM 6759 / NRRL 1006) TaxID=441959 RepID=B8MTE1_TALSN|nr:heat shock protein Hsp30/Hsp42, putative [Talaromyces stipitatus ATCC 10500]EED12186.1 heat shock protein Hsp30/Hsp42, putative [Talaromyces stipitatus ATCC 10500]
MADSRIPNDGYIYPLRAPAQRPQLYDNTLKQTTIEMALFPRTGDFAPLFRLLDDYDLHRSGRGGQSQSSITSFAPRFDVRESKDAYHLDGELPGIAQKDIEIEFSDPQTLTIKGRAVREYHSGNLDNEGENANAPKPASVEDANDKDNKAVQKSSDKKEVSKNRDNYKYWVSERSVGEFHRSFNFPSRVDQDGVKANLKNGILSIVVPKAAPPSSRKINIE